MTDAIISGRDLYFTYADATEALRNVSLDIYPNEVFVIFGPSRAGKSTLLRLFNRLSDLIDGTERRGTVTLAENTVVYVPGHTAHRTVNTGSEPLVYWGILSSEAGHDYGAVGKRNFRQVIVEVTVSPW